MIWLLKWIIPLYVWLAISFLSLMAIIRMRMSQSFLNQLQKLVNYFVEFLLQNQYKTTPKKVKIFKQGDVVVLLDIRGKYPDSTHNPSIGSIHECEGVVVNIVQIPTRAEEMAMVPVDVRWANGFTNQYRVCDIEHLDIFLNSVSAKRAAEADVVLFKPGDIVYIRPGTHDANKEWPVIGSDYETDLKVIEVTTSKFKSILKYRLFNPSTQTYLYARHKELVTPQEKLKYRTSLFYKSNISIPGILNTDDLFFQLGDHFYNEAETVILKVTPKISKIFTKTKI